MRLGVVVPCHNDAPYLGRCLAAIHAAGPSTAVVVVDRCSDASRDVALSAGRDLVLEKPTTSWRNSTAENLELGFRLLLDRDYVAVVGADTLVPANFWHETVSLLEADPGLASVSGVMHAADPLYHSYELFLESLGLAHHLRSSGRVYRMSAIRAFLFADHQAVEDGIAEDLRLDAKLLPAGGSAALPSVRMVDVRRWSLGKSLRGQFNSGRARRILGRPLRQCFGELPRLRPFVVVGWLVGGEGDDEEGRAP
ncbi:MAG: glycosyltransferase family 2 protein [Nitrososphaerota archaeon]|nr:glycosyltransferase family 2 protein [Nitrososphaerota archaeon]MDG7022871.1 glycosyltransferase family 2 protein [Nitrososphaerota archaeon]